MSASFPRLMVRVALLAAFAASAASSYAQIPAASSAREIPTEVQQSEERVTQDHRRPRIISVKENSTSRTASANKRAKSLIEQSIRFSESGFDVRASQKLQTYYLELVERIYREEVPLQQPVAAEHCDMHWWPTHAQDHARLHRRAVGFREQKFEPSPLDDFSKLVLTPEETECH